MKDIVCSIIGHIDHGKTMFIDTILNLKVVQKEEGRITQRLQAYKLQYAQILQYFTTFKLDKIDKYNILFIDTPGHASFHDIKSRAIIICDIVLLFIDVIKGIEPQVLELINLLIQNNTFFIIILTKLDLISEWETKTVVFKDNLKLQNSIALIKFQECISRIRQTMWGLGKDILPYNQYAKQNNEDMIPFIGISSFTKEGFADLFLFISYVAFSKINDRSYIYVLDYFVDVATKYVLLIKNSEIKVNQIFQSVNNSIKIKKIYVDPYNSPIYTTKYSGTDIISCEIKTSFPLKIGDYIGSFDSYKSNVSGIIIKANSLGSLEGLVSSLKNNKIQILQASVGSVNKRDVLLTENNISKYNQVLINYNLPLKIFKTSAFVINESTIYNVLKKLEEYHKKLDQQLLTSIKKQIKSIISIKFLKQFVLSATKPYILGFELITGELNQNQELIDLYQNSIKIQSMQIDNKALLRIIQPKTQFASKITCDVDLLNFEENWFTDLSKHLTDLNKISYLLTNTQKEVLKKNNEKNNYNKS